MRSGSGQLFRMTVPTRPDLTRHTMEKMMKKYAKGTLETLILVRLLQLAASKQPVVRTPKSPQGQGMTLEPLSPTHVY